MTEVVIVGGGPVGLFLAALLLQQGVGVRVLEQRVSPNTHSRAIGIHPPSMEALDAVGVAGTLASDGVQIRRGVALWAGKEFAHMRFDTIPARYPFILSVPQALTEAVLARRVRELDSDAVRAGVRAIGLRDDGGTLIADTESISGRGSFRAALVIAADGAHSTVRELLGTPTRLKTYPDAYLMGDFADNTPFGPDAALFLDAQGIVESFPLPGGTRRWVARLPAGPPRAETPALSAERLAALLRQRTGLTVDAGSNSMMSGFGVRSRGVRRMVQGRTFFIGDAAHEISPIGGQGMNLGWMDALALAPIITAFLAGVVTDREVRSYDRTRRRAAARAMRQAEINMALGRPLPPPALAVRNLTIGRLAAIPAINSGVARRFTMR
ncbi:FAD-dependent oxidoreductase [Arthrobacter sp. 92]|uniref:FAD-dependent oxidoreductase n=1 Tax=Arthrobacter sp. 92 TaxID=3418175 RepID=UPI003D007163